MSSKWMRWVTAMVATLVLGTTMAQASWYNPASWFKSKPKPVPVLVVTGNFVHSRMLAELIQYQAKYPILILPTGKETTLYAMAGDGKAVEVPRDRYVEFVRTLQPKTVLFLGNDDYVPAEFVDEISSRFTCAPLKGNDWQKIAVSAGDLLTLPTLAKEYRRLTDKLDAHGDASTGIDPASIWKTPEEKAKAEAAAAAAAARANENK